MDEGPLWRRWTVRVALALAPSLVYGCYARYPLWAALPYFAFVPWVLLYSDPRRPKVSAGWFILGAWVFWMVNYWPQTSQYGWYATPAMAAVFFVPWIVYPFLMRPISRGFDLPRALTFPLVWVAVEWIRAEYSLSHFDLHRLGYSQGRFTALIQITDLTGVYGVSFLVAAVNGWIADLWILARDGGGVRKAIRTRRIVASLLLILAGFGTAITYGIVRLATARHEEGPRIAVVQPNIRHTIRNAVGVHVGQILLTERNVAPGEADLIVWPENAILDNIRREGAYLDDLSWLATRKDAWILLGAMGKPPDSPGRTSNSAFLVDPGGTIRGEYQKQMLYPWSEFVPFDGFLRRWAPPVWRLHRSLVRKAWGFLSPGTAGDDMTLLHFPWNGETIPMGIIICVENTYPPIPAEAGRRGARLFVNITSEGEASGIGIQEQLLRICMMRAVENRIPYVRCGNTGISAFIDPEGRIRELLLGERGSAISDAGVLVAPAILAPDVGPTIYARSHDLFALTCLAVSLGLAGVGIFRRTPRWGGRVAVVVLVGLTLSCGAGQSEMEPGRGLEEGRSLLLNGNASASLGPLTRACTEEKVCRETLPLLAEAYRRTEEAETAAVVFGDIANRFPALAPEAISMRGFFLEQALDLEGAERDYRRSLSEEPSARTWILLGRVRLRMDDFAGAADAFEQAHRIDPSDPDARFLWNRARWLDGEVEAVRRDLERAVREHPDHGRTWALLGRVRDLSGDETGAEVAWRRAILADPSNIEARFMLTRKALRAGRLDDVRVWLGEITKIEEGLGRGLAED